MASSGSLFNDGAPAGLRVAQAVGITASTYLFGGNATISFVGIPAILQAPAPLAARQWHKAYDIGKSFGISLSIISSLCTAYVAYHQNRSSLPFKLNAAATLIFPSIIPFTLTFIAPINDKLFAKEKQLASSSLEDKAVEAGVASGETVHALLDKWATLGLVRSAITGVGAILVIWAALDRSSGAESFGLASGANRI